MLYIIFLNLNDDFKFGNNEGNKQPGNKRINGQVAYLHSLYWLFYQRFQHSTLSHSFLRFFFYTCIGPIGTFGNFQQALTPQAHHELQITRILYTKKKTGRPMNAWGTALILDKFLKIINILDKVS